MIKALWNQVIMKRLPGDNDETKSAGGIIIPAGVGLDKKSNMLRAIVLDVGPGRDDKPALIRDGHDVRIGDVVEFNKYAADFFVLDGYDLMIASSLDVWAVVTGSKAVYPEDVGRELAEFELRRDRVDREAFLVAVREYADRFKAKALQPDSPPDPLPEG